MKLLPSTAFVLSVLLAPAIAQEPAPESAPAEGKPRLASATFGGMKFRGIGPALMSGRIGDFAVDPEQPGRYFVAVCSGGVWRTTNAGTTYEPVFDSQGSYSIGCVTLDPTNPNVVWVGTGENNSQRSVSFGDGVYKSVDGGKSWKNVGLKESEHIGMIVVDSLSPDTVYVAAQGPLWKAGGERGLYKTTDGGESWEKVLEVDEHTGVNEVHMDPRDSSVLYASTYQRRRRVWTLINGGPGSAIWKSIDGGESWRKLEKGLPKVDLGRIGMDISPADPDVVYAIVEAAEDKGGFFRSCDRGETWEKRSSWMTTSPQYYNEIFCHPSDADKVYALNTFTSYTEDGGKTFARLGLSNRHVDDHAFWIDPRNAEHLLIGGDGGIYETWDHGKHWDFKENLPVTQFYRVAVDSSVPFYYIYGGTQDNATQGGPSRTTSAAGIASEDWFLTVGGDGFVTRVDPLDPNIVYSEWQHGGLVRYDRRSGERVDIKPREAIGEEPIRWNWDSPLIISPHAHTRLYFAGSKIFRSEDRGDSWTCISPELSRGLDRNQLEVMGKVWTADAVSKNRSTSIYGNIVALSESPLVENLLYAGTDDGLIQVSPDGGESWRRLDAFPGIPELSYVSDLEASRHDGDTVYAAFDNHKSGDFAPYLLRSTDRGASWSSIAGDLPERHHVHAVAEDRERPGMLFAGTEFGVFFTLDGGAHWIQLKGGVPTIAVRDLAVQDRERDLVLGTFGRGFYVLDDYSPLALVSEEALAKEALLFPVRPALQYVPSARLGGRDGRGSQGASFYTAPNPPFGALITYYLEKEIESLREQRRAAEKKAVKKGETPPYPKIEELRAEDQELAPALFLCIRDAAGAVVRRIPVPRAKGFHRVAWDLRYPSAAPTRISQGGALAPWQRRDAGPMVAPGSYTVELVKRVEEELSVLAGPEPVEVRALDLGTYGAGDRASALSFQLEVQELRRAMGGASRIVSATQDRIAHLRQAWLDTPGAAPELLAKLRELELSLTALRTELLGDDTLRSREEPAPISLNERIESIVGSQWHTTASPTRAERDEYRASSAAFALWLDELKQLVEVALPALEKRFEKAGAPWTPGRFPGWKR